MTTITTSHRNHYPFALLAGLVLLALVLAAAIAVIVDDSSSSSSRVAPAVSTPAVTGSMSPDAIDRSPATSRAYQSPDAVDRVAPQAATTGDVQIVSPDAVDRVAPAPAGPSYGSPDSLDR